MESLWGDVDLDGGARRRGGIRSAQQVKDQGGGWKELTQRARVRV